jgi:hypothetical protein
MNTNRLLEILISDTLNYKNISVSHTTLNKIIEITQTSYGAVFVNPETNELDVINVYTTPYNSTDIILQNKAVITNWYKITASLVQLNLSGINTLEDISFNLGIPFGRLTNQSWEYTNDYINLLESIYSNISGLLEFIQSTGLLTYIEVVPVEEPINVPVYMTNEFYNELLRKFIMKKLEKEINDEV